MFDLNDLISTNHTPNSPTTCPAVILVGIFHFMTWKFLIAFTSPYYPFFNSCGGDSVNSLIVGEFVQRRFLNNVDNGRDEVHRAAHLDCIK